MTGPTKGVRNVPKDVGGEKSGTHPYCVLPGSASTPHDLRGLEGSRVRAFSFGSLTVWASELDRRPERTVESLRIHDRVVRRGLSAGSAVLPIRFGFWSEGPPGLRTRLGARQDELGAALRRIEGAEEYGIRVFEDAGTGGRDRSPGAEGPATATCERPGMAYLLRVARAREDRRRRRRRADEVLAELASRLSGLAREERVEDGDGVGLVAVAHLVARERAASYRRAVTSFQAEHPELRVVRTGPWAPYSFASCPW